MGVYQAMKKGKILWCLQTWSGDLAQADALARLLTDCTLHANAGQKSPHADFLLCVRWDTEIPMELARYCGRAFEHVRLFRCRNRVSGWPAGPNNMAMEAYRYYVSKQETGVWKYSGLMLTEPDSIPLTVDCIARIHREWNATAKPVLGAFIGSFPGGKEWTGTEHVNGNLVISSDFATTHPQVLAHVPNIAWDAHWRRELRANAKASLQIHSDYKMGLPENPWDGNCDRLWQSIKHAGSHPLAGIEFKPSWIHGPKTPAALACARERLLPLAINEIA
jgi:hypothetical protein